MGLDQAVLLRQIDDALLRCSIRSPKGYDDFSDVPEDRISEAVNILFAAV